MARRIEVSVDAFRRQVQETRKRKGWTQEQLADAISKLGWPIDQEKVSRIEPPRHTKGSKNKARKSVSLEEVLVFAAALEVSPVQLIVPGGSGARMKLFNGGKTFDASAVRGWLYNLEPLPGMDDRFFQESISEDEYNAREEEYATAMAEMAEYDDWKARNQ